MAEDAKQAEKKDAALDFSDDEDDIFLLLALSQMTISLSAAVDNQFTKLSKRELRQRRRNRGIGSGNGARAQSQPLPERDPTSEWEQLPPEMFLYQLGFYPWDFADIVHDVEAAVQEPRPRRNVDGKDTVPNGSGRPRKLSVKNQVTNSCLQCSR